MNKNLAYEIRREEIREPREILCRVERGKQYKLLAGIYGELMLPDEFVPEELRRPPGKDYWDYFFADVAADLDSGTVTQFQFKEYLKRATPEEIAQIPGI